MITEYTQAFARIAALQAQDTDAINPLCRTQLLTHGRKVERAVVFLHGFTNCPQQFARLAQTFFDLGCNVLVPRIPHHGFANRLSDEMAQLTAAELLTLTDEAIDVAHGLGEHVTLAGLSLGGTLVLWAAQRRADLDHAVAIAPFIAPRNIPTVSVAWLTKLLSGLPNFFVWWDPRLRATMPGPPHAYPRFSSHGFAAMLQIAETVQADVPPRARRITFITNANDPALNNAPTHTVARAWQASGAASIVTYEFDASLNLIHDIIDEQQAGQRTEIVYPIVMRLIDNGDINGVP